MIKTTLAVMASLMLVACGSGDDPKGNNPEGQQAKNTDTNTPDPKKVEANTPDSDKAANPAPVLGAKPELTLTYFNLGG